MEKSEIQQQTRNLIARLGHPDEFVNRFQEILENNIEKEKTKNYQRIIPDTGKFYGVPKPTLWIIAGEIGKFIQNEPIQVESILRILWKEGSFEAKQITGKSLEKISPKYPQLILDFISSILPDIDNWSVCDCLAMYSVEPIVYSNPGLVLPLAKEWVKHPDKWIRRFGVVALQGYKKVKTTEDVFQILEVAMKDHDTDVKKAVAWVLREITKRNPEQVAGFLKDWLTTKPSKKSVWIVKQGMKKLSQEKQSELLTYLSDI